MAWIVGLLVLIGFAYLMFASSRFRRFGFGMFILLAVAALAIWLVTIYSNHKTDERRAEAESLVVPEDLTIIDISMDRPSSYADIRGTVLNNSWHPIQSINLLVIIKDCPSPISPDGCVVIGQDEVIFRVNIPAGQAREITGSADFSDSPTPQGYFAWSYTITRIVADLDGNPYTE